MAVEFRCEKCGKMLRVEADKHSMVRCMHCKTKTSVPAGLASLPEPLLPPGALAVPVAADRQGELAVAVHAADGETVLSRSMPWVLSVFFHAALALILVFLTMLVVKAVPPPEPVTLVDPKAPAGPMVESEHRHRERQPSQPRPTDQRGASQHEGALREDTGVTDSPLEGLIGLSSSGPSGDILAPQGPPRHTGTIFGSPQRVQASQVVFVIDRSGSMIDSFDWVRVEMIKSISMLKPSQSFHVILFATGEPMEHGPKGLVKATREQQNSVVEFLARVRPSGKTDPVPALRRAFEVLSQAGKGPKVIYLLTDAVFPDSAGVVELVRKANAGKGVRINTYLYGYQPPEAAATMKAIAAESGGFYKYVSPDE